jgi:lipopolysaccharide export LptBFGC system permease protein LptF
MTRGEKTKKKELTLSMEEKQFWYFIVFMFCFFMAWLIPSVGRHAYDTIFSGCHSFFLYWTFFSVYKSPGIWYKSGYTYIRGVCLLDLKFEYLLARAI